MSELELAIDALTAFAELVRDDGSLDGERREIELRSDDRAALLAEWLEELVYLADVQQFVPEHLTDLQLDADTLRGTVRGHRGEPSALVKAVTRHRLSFEADRDGGWHARVVL